MNLCQDVPLLKLSLNQIGFKDGEVVSERLDHHNGMRSAITVC